MQHTDFHWLHSLQFLMVTNICLLYYFCLFLSPKQKNILLDTAWRSVRCFHLRQDSTGLALACMKEQTPHSQIPSILRHCRTTAILLCSRLSSKRHQMLACLRSNRKNPTISIWYWACRMEKVKKGGGVAS